MGVSIKYVGERRRRAALRRAIWDTIERGLDQELDIDAANEIVTELCEAVNTVVEDMRTVEEFNRLGYHKKHWYNLELHISGDRVTSQNTLEGAESLPPHPPTRAQLWLGFMRFGGLDAFAVQEDNIHSTF